MTYEGGRYQGRHSRPEGDDEAARFLMLPPADLPPDWQHTDIMPILRDPARPPRRQGIAVYSPACDAAPRRSRPVRALHAFRRLLWRLAYKFTV